MVDIQVLSANQISHQWTGVTPGTYKVTVSAPGYIPQQETVVVPESGTASVSLTLVEDNSTWIAKDARKINELVGSLYDLVTDEMTEEESAPIDTLIQEGEAILEDFFNTVGIDQDVYDWLIEAKQTVHDWGTSFYDAATLDWKINFDDWYSDMDELTQDILKNINKWSTWIMYGGIAVILIIVMGALK
jgi:hypothetical protein